MTAEKCIPLHILQKITNGFSEHSRIGRGGYGDVYKGDYEGTEIAVKLLNVDAALGLDDRQYSNEVANLSRVKHPNIVQLLGYCYDITNELIERNGVKEFRKHIYRILCFEYLPDGSLDKHLCDQSFAPNWSERYNIIKGICEGLNFLHERDPQILHLDLKPANILLDSSMEPKLADFGLSRLFTESHTHVTQRVIGTRKYMPPEFIEQRKISPKNDVFSLGVVMIEIITGPADYSNSFEMDDVAQLKQQVLTKWSTTIEATSKYQSEELHQVKTCIDIAMHCVDSEKDNRPTVADILDTLNKTEAHIPKKQVADMLPCQTLGTTNRMAKSLSTVTTEVGNITSKHEHSDFMPRGTFNINVQQVPDRETSSDVQQTLIIGRTEVKHEILSILSECITEEMAILPIYGVGGIGKTTLAQLVFNDTQFQGYSRVWVYVPQEFDLNKVGNSIISQLTKQSSHIADKQMLHNRLGELLFGKRFLIVLDDLWEEDPYNLDKLKAMLRLGQGNKVILVTTRDEAVARKICCTVTPYKLETLTDDMCWIIIQQKSNFQNRRDKDQLKQIGKDISIKCGGVALAAQSLGYMLRDMTSDQWESVRDNDIWNLSTDPSLRNQEVLASLRLSYSHMPKWLQLCFSYCAVFPKGHCIVKQDLIHQWIALGFAEPSKTFDSFQLCEKYVTQLLGLSFLEYSKAPSTHGRREKSVTLFTMHDLVHDLARAMLADKVNEKDNAVGSSCHYALLTDCSKPLQLSLSSPENTCFKIFFNPFQRKSSPENIKALFFLDCGEIKLHGGAFSPAKFLHVLDLSECYIQKLPGSIGQLKNLRYLHAPRIQDKKIPNCITKLSQLNYLNIRDSHNISALPESIGDMKGLMHLDLSGCDGIREFPVSFAELKQLVHLDLSNCWMSTSEAFGGFTELQYLNLSTESRIDRHNRRGLSKVISNLVKLRYLNLSGCMEEDQMHSLVVSISTLHNLEHLDLSENSLLFSIPESIGNLRKLHTLDLSACCSLSKLPDSMANMVSLKVLLVDKEVTLDEPTLSRSNFAPLPHFVVHASSDKCGSNISLLEPTNPDKLVIDRLENVKSVEEAQGIKLKEKHKIEELTFQWTVTAERFVDDKGVLEKLVPPSSVKKLSITGYRSIGFPDWLMGMWRYLPNLCELNLGDIHNLPPLGQLLNLKQLSLHRMEGLEECKTTDPNASSSSLITHLSVDESKVPMHEWRLLHHLPDLCRLTINSCSDLTASPEIIQQLSSLESLHLEFSFLEQAELPRWLVELTSLQRLSLSQCKSMTSLPEWLGELTHLKRIEIEDCEGITSLPDSIQQLTKLNYITICDCYLLVKWCESKDNWKKFADITKVQVLPPLRDGYIFKETHPNLLYGAVMNMPGFTEEDLIRLMNDNACISTYMDMREEDREKWLRNWLAKDY